MLVVAFTLQLSGAGHAIADALACADHGVHEDDDCSEQGGECPPGCPDCHCHHTGSCAVQAAVAEPVVFATTVEFVPLHEARPAAPALDQPYRPPRR